MAEADIDAASITTGDQGRDDHLRSANFLDVASYPMLHFRSTRVEPSGEDQYRVVGDLTVRGTTRPVTLETSFTGRSKNPCGQEVAGFTTETQLNRKDFGLTWNAALESGGLLVGDKLTVLVEIQAIRKSWAVTDRSARRARPAQPWCVLVRLIWGRAPTRLC